jgi:hypothetical protein
LVAHDHIYGEAVRENVMVKYSPDQKWYYLSAQMPSELLLFRQADSENRTGKRCNPLSLQKYLTSVFVGVPHIAFDISEVMGTDEITQRESIECRILLCFED